MDPHSPNKLFATKYCFLILEDEFLFLSHFFIFIFIFLLFYVILLLSIFTKTMLLLSFFLINFFFHENYFYLFMFRDVPACSGMFRNVPCSWFYRRPSILWLILPSVKFRQIQQISSPDGKKNRWNAQMKSGSSRKY